MTEEYIRRSVMLSCLPNYPSGHCSTDFLRAQLPVLVLTIQEYFWNYANRPRSLPAARVDFLQKQGRNRGQHRRCRHPGRIRPEEFFSKNHVTSGMKSLLEQVFDRLLEASEQGVFRLKEAMGGARLTA